MSQVTSQKLPDPDPAATRPLQSATKPMGWFVSRRANRFHYDPGTGQSLCGKVSSQGLIHADHTPNHALNCCKCRYHVARRQRSPDETDAL